MPGGIIALGIFIVAMIVANIVITIENNKRDGIN